MVATRDTYGLPPAANSMNRERLTPDRIRRLALPDGAAQFFLWDTDAPRMAVRVTAGAKSSSSSPS